MTRPRTLNAPLISVCMPVYNAKRYVEEAVESILGQTFRDFEFLIIDDGSTDRSLPILERYAAQDARIRLSSRPNAGHTVRLNEMLHQARGDLIARMDADDVAFPSGLPGKLSFSVAIPKWMLSEGPTRTSIQGSPPVCTTRTRGARRNTVACF